MKAHLLIAVAGLTALLATTVVQAEVPRTRPANNPTLAVQAEGTGASQELAKRQAFRNAIEQAVGSVVVGEQEAQGGQLTRDFTGSYSAGYVDRYELVDSYYDESTRQWHVTVVAWVASSRLPQRMLSDKPGAINVDRAQTQLGSQLEQRQNGDQLLSLVLNNYPDNAYVINSGQTEIKIGNLRQSSVEIPYSLTMNQHWIESFKEALAVVSVKNADCNRLAIRIADRLRADPNRGPAVKELGSRLCPNDFDVQVFSKPPGNWFTQSDGYYFADLQTLQVVNTAIRPPQGQQHIGIRADLIDSNGSIIESRCSRINNERFINYRQPQGTVNYNDLARNSLPNVMAHENVYGTLELPLTRQHQLKNLSSIRLSVQKTC
jgi:hypothetical protein